MSDLYPKTENAPPRAAGASKEPIEVYSYRDEAGTVLYQALRYEPKDFRQRVPLQGGGYEWKLNGVRRVPYLLPQLLKADPELPVYIVEGEKDAKTLTKMGFVATTNVGGAGKWRDDYSVFLKGRRVVVLPDNDEPGRDHARKVAASVQPYARSVKIIELPGLPPKGDVSDWLTQGHSAGQLADLASKAPEWSAETDPGPYALASIGDLFAEPVLDLPWLVEDLLVEGGFSLMVARPKVGKSTLARNLLLQVAQGRDFLGRYCERGAVVYWALEEKREAVIAHFRSLGARPGDEVRLHIGPPPPNAMEALSAQIVKYKARLAVVDPLIRFGGITDVNDYAQVYRALTPLVDLARATGCHIMALHHSNKLIQLENGIPNTLSVMGSTAFTGNVDATIVLTKQPDGKRVIFSEQRYGRDFEPSVISMDEESGVIHLAAPLDEYELLQTERAILDYLRGKPEGASELEIKQDVEARTEKIVRALRVLVGAQPPQVIRLGTGKRGDAFRYMHPDNWEPERGGS